MIPINQTIYDKGRGDCLRANVASILELEIIQVPHFILFPGSKWSDVLFAFMWALGWDYKGHTTLFQSAMYPITESDSINGYFLAVVPSRNFENTSHSVIIDVAGKVVHDPSPNKNYQDENIFTSKSLEYWYRFAKLLK